jgi:hypothetical protein
MGGKRVRKKEGGLWLGKWRSIKDLKKGRVMDGEKKGELWVGKWGWIRMGKRRRVMSEINGDGYEWEKG